LQFVGRFYVEPEEKDQSW
jgi:hypothetical protein